MASHVGHGDLRRLLHDVAELTGERQALRSLGHAGFDEQDVAAGAGHRESGGDPGHAGAIGRLEVEVRSSEPVTNRTRLHDDRRLALAGGQLRRRLAEQSPDLSLQVPNARFACVVDDDDAQRLIVDDDFVVAQCRAGELSTDQVVASDRDLLGLGVAVESDDFHSVEQRTGNRVDHVGRRDEHHA